MVKIYQATHNVCLSTSIFIDGKELIIAFERGANCGRDGRNKVNGCYHTSSPVIQKAIESDRRYGKVFKLIAIEEEGVVKPVDTPKPKTERKSVSKTKDESKQEAKSELEVVDFIVNKQQAIEFLAVRNVNMPKTCKVDAIKEAAAKEGFTFPNWN